MSTTNDFLLDFSIRVVHTEHGIFMYMTALSADGNERRTEYGPLDEHNFSANQSDMFTTMRNDFWNLRKRIEKGKYTNGTTTTHLPPAEK